MREKLNTLLKKKIVYMWILFPVSFLAVLLIFSVSGKFIKENMKAGSVKTIPQGWSIICPKDEFSAIVGQGDVIWAGGRDGVYKIDRKHSVLIEKLKLDMDVTYVKALCVDNDGRLWIGFQDGVAVYGKGKYNYYNSENGLPDNRVNCIKQDKSGRMLIGTWGGAAVYNNGQWNKITVKEGLAVNMVNVICEDNIGGFWFGAYSVPGGAVSYSNNGLWQYFTTENGLPNSNVTSIFEDDKGNVWVGTGLLDKGGACKTVFKNEKWVIEEALSKDDGLAGEKVRSIFQDNLGNMWFCSEYDGAALIRQNKTTILKEKDGLSNNEIKALIQDTDGNMWLATREGITFISFDALKMIN